MPWSKEDRSFKILINRRVTSSAKAYYEEFGDNTLDISFSEIKTDIIPFNDPTTAIGNSVAKSYALFTLTPDETVGIPGTSSQQSFYAFDLTDPTASADFRLRDWIGEKYGSNFRLRLYDNNNTEITPTECDWFFDYPTGILTLNGNPQNYAKPFKVSGYRYIGNKGGAVGGNGFIGQKPVYDQLFFPSSAAAADQHIPVYVAANDRYELQPFTSLPSNDIELVSKHFVVSTPANIFLTDSDIHRILYVSINGLVQEETDDYSYQPPRTIAFNAPIETGKIVVIKYFENLASVGTGQDTSDPMLFSFEVTDASGEIAHYHVAELRFSHIKSLIQDRVSSVDIVSSEVGGHTHTLTITYDDALATFDVSDVTGSDTTAKLIGAGSTNNTVGIEKENYLLAIDASNAIPVPNPPAGETRKMFLDIHLTSNGRTQVSSISNVENERIVRIYPTTQNIIFTNTDYIRTEGGLNVTVHGENGDWIEFIIKGGIAYQNNIGTYVQPPSDIKIVTG